MKITKDSLTVRTLKWGGIAMGLSLAAAFASLPRRASADPDHHPHRHGPPPAAFDACKGKKADDACEVTFGDRKITGKCASRDQGLLACRPDRPMGPPPELFAACEGKSEGDSCSVTFEDKTHAGTCAKGRAGRLLCRP